MAKEDLMGGFSSLPEPDKGDYESKDTTSKVEQHLKQFSGARSEPPSPEPEKESKKEPTEEPESTPEPEIEKPADDGKSTSEPDGEPAAGPAIPDNHYRALIHSGWKPEKISQLYEKDPDLLLELAEKAFDDVNNLTRQFSNLGRAKIEWEKAQAKPQPQPQPQAQPQQVGPDVEKLRVKYEEDPFGATVDLLKAFTQPQQVPVQQPAMQQPAPQQPAVSRDQFDEDLALTQHLIGFWGDEGMKPYGDFYGPMFDEKGNPYLTADHLTPGQAANRQHVLIEADRIIAGAVLQGENMPIQQALAMAHMVVSAPIAKQIIRNELVSQVKKQAKGVTLRPSSRKTIVPPRKEGEGLAEKDLEKTTKVRLDAFKEGKPLK